MPLNAGFRMSKKVAKGLVQKRLEIAAINCVVEGR